VAAHRKKHEEHEEHVNHERWLITYADMITLLMVLFIVLFAIGQTDLAKFQALKTGLQQSLGGSSGSPVLAGGAGNLGGTPTALSPLVPNLSANATPASVLQQKALAALQSQDAAQQAQLAERQSLTTTQAALQAALNAKGLGSSVKFQLDSRGLVVTIVTDQVLYDTDSAVLQPKGEEILGSIAPTLATLPNDVVIEGHTDDQPVTGGPYASNWELSTARATAVLRYLVDSLHLNPQRLSAAGYGPERPLVPNTSDANRAINRRVEAVILSTVNLTAGTTSS